MIDQFATNLAPFMFVVVMGLLLIGYPIAFTLAAGGLGFFLLGEALSQFSSEIRLTWPLLQSHPERIYAIMYNETLLAVPFFTFMGLILERSRMAEDLLDTVGQLFGPVRGGLAYATIFVGALLAASTGVVSASVIAMGLISLPIMMRYGYNSSLAAGTIVASGTLAQIVPPSLVLIVMADQLGQSVGDMYIAAFLPAGITIFLFCAYIFLRGLLNPAATPALPPEARVLGSGVRSLLAMVVLGIGIFFASREILSTSSSAETSEVWAATFAVMTLFLLSLANRTLGLRILSPLCEHVILVLIPPLALIFLVLGTIFLGIATPTEGGAMGATGAMVLAVFKRRLSLAVLREALKATARLSAFVMFILIGARIFSLTFYGIDGNIWIEDILISVPGGVMGFLIFVTAVVFILGCFLDFFEIAFIVVPLMAPVAERMGIDLVWFGIILTINLQTSFLTPPFGFSLFYLRSVAPSRAWDDPQTHQTMPAVRTLDIYRGSLPFIAIQMLVVALTIIFPDIVTHYADQGPNVDPAGINIEIPSFDDESQPSDGLGLINSIPDPTRN